MAFEYCTSGGRRFYGFMYRRRIDRQEEAFCGLRRTWPRVKRSAAYLKDYEPKQTAMMYARKTAHEIGLVNKII